MKKNNPIPNKQYFEQAKKLLYGGDVNLTEKKYDYYHVNEKIYDSEKFQQLLATNSIDQIIKISSGTSDRKAFSPYIKRAIKDLNRSNFYRNYTSAKGSINARRAIAIKESIKLKNNKNYTEIDICITEGSTGAITTVFEYIKTLYKDAQVLIASPAYYLYKFSAEYYNLPYKEIFTLKPSSSPTLSLEKVIQNITNKTKLIVITQPNNPTGEVYNNDEVKKLLDIAKKKDILIMADELFFDLLFKDSCQNTDTIASEINALNNVVIIKGYSKTKNLAAFRIGYLLSKNNKLLDYAEKISEQRQCFAGAYNYTNVIILDSFIQSTNEIILKNGVQNIREVIKQVKKEFKFTNLIQEYTLQELLTLFNNYQIYTQKNLDFYSKNYDLSQDLLQNDLSIIIPKRSAFNTLVKIKGLEKVNYFDFCFNFYLTCGVETQIGPCYAFDQKTWENDSNLGFWLRLSFSRDKTLFLNGIRKLLEFKEIYLENPTKFLQTNLYF